MTLSHRERVIKTLRHEEPNRVLFDLGSHVNSGIHIKESQELKAYFGVEAKDHIFPRMTQTSVVHEPVLQALDIDFRRVRLGAPNIRLETPAGNLISSP